MTYTKSNMSLFTTNDSTIDWGLSEGKTKKDGGSGSISSGREFDASTSTLTSVEAGKAKFNILGESFMHGSGARCLSINIFLFDSHSPSFLPLHVKIRGSPCATIQRP